MESLPSKWSEKNSDKNEPKPQREGDSQTEETVSEKEAREDPTFQNHQLL